MTGSRHLKTVSTAMSQLQMPTNATYYLCSDGGVGSLDLSRLAGESKKDDGTGANPLVIACCPTSTASLA